MPIPKPSKGEGQKDFMARCMRTLAETDSDRPQNQRAAMCYSSFREGKNTKASEGLEEMPDLHFALFSDNQNYNSVFTKKRGVRLWRKQVLKFGTWKHPDNPDVEFEITPDVAQQIVANFHAGVPDESPVVLTHTDNPMAKVGRVKGFVVTATGLDAVLSIDDDAVNEKIELKAESTPGVSCWLDLSYKDKKTGEEIGAVVKHVALVNHPYIEGMEGFRAVLSEFKEDAKDVMPMVWSEKKSGKEKEPMPATKEELIKALKEEFSLDVEALLSDQQKLIGLHKRISDGELIAKDDVSLSDEIMKDLRAKLNLADGEKLDAAGAIKLLVAKITELSGMADRLKVTEEKLSDMEIKEKFGTLLSQGRALPKEKETFSELFKSNKPLFDKMVKARMESDPLIKLSEEKGTQGNDQEGDKEQKSKEALTRMLEAAKAEGRVPKE